MLQLILIILFAAGGKIEHTSIELTGLPQINPSTILIDDKQNCWVSDYSEHIVAKFAADGKYLFQLGRDGHGPGEIFKPYAMVLLDEDQTILVSSNQGQTQYFGTKTGAYLKQRLPISFMFQAFALEHDKIFLPFSPLPGKKTVHHIINRKGEVLDGWFSKAWLEAYVMKKESTGSFQTAFMHDDHTVYFADPYHPVVLYLKKKEKEPRKWELRIPKGFREVPAPLPPGAGFDPIKHDKWYNSFSKLFIYPLGKNYLAASWLNSEFAPNILQIYNIKTKELVVNNVETINYIRYANENKLYCTEIRDSGNIDDYDRLFLHTYTFIQ